MSAMFSGAKTFNEDISQWDVSGVIDMSTMFSCVKAFNGDLSKWYVSNENDMSAANAFWCESV